MSDKPTTPKPDSPAEKTEQPTPAADKPAAAAPATQAPATPAAPATKSLWIASAIVVLVFSGIWGAIWLNVINPARATWQPRADNAAKLRANAANADINANAPGPQPAQTRPQTRPGH